MADYPTWAGMTPLVRYRLTHDLGRFLEKIGGTGVRVDAAVREGDVVGEILQAASALPADLIVMGTHGRGGFQRWILGSATEKILRQAPCPVMTICHVRPALPSSGALFKTILCAVDFSRSSLKALDHALSLAQEAGSRLTVLHVVDSLAEEDPMAQAHFNVPEFRRLLVRDARERLRQVVSEEARNWCEIDEIVVAGNAPRAILRRAGESGAGLIVMGAHGDGVLEPLVFGSTSHHVVRGADCPVLTIRAA